MILLVSAAGCRDAPEEPKATDAALDQLKEQIEREYEAIQAQYKQTGRDMPPEVREMTDHLEIMFAQIRQIERGADVAEVAVAVHDAEGDTTVRATREWHEQMIAMHEAAALMHQDDSLAARHRRLMQYHRQLMQLLPARVAADRPDAAGPQASAGAALYVPYCAACHGQDGQGAGSIFPPLAGSALVTSDPDDLIRVVLHGLEGPITVRGETYEGSMPPFGPRLTDQEVAAILTYIRSAWGNNAGAVSPTEVREVREQYAGRIQPWTAPTLDLHEEE